MAQEYDVALKLLFHHSTGLVARRLFGEPVIEWVNVEQPRVTNFRADLLARLAGGGLRHIELQASNDGEIGRREAEYHLGFHRILGEDVEHVVLYVGREAMRMTPVFKTRSMTFEFQLLDIRDFDPEPLIESEDWGDNILAILTPADRERVLQRVEDRIRRLKGEEQAVAVRLAVIVSGIIGMEGQVSERLNMIDIMENKVIGPAIRKGIRQADTRTLTRQLERKFGNPPSAKLLERIEGATDEELQMWLMRILDAPTMSAVFAE